MTTLPSPSDEERIARSEISRLAPLNDDGVP